MSYGTNPQVLPRKSYEASLRRAIADLEAELAVLLDNPKSTHEQCRDAREKIGRLRAELPR